MSLDRVSNTAKKFLDGYACSQAILSEYCNDFNLNPRTALNLTAGFAGGMRRGKTCGAITGAIMVLGLKFGSQNSETPDGRKRIYKAVREFTDLYEKQHGSINCKDLLGVDISTESGLRTAKEHDLFKTLCPKFVKSAVEILEVIFTER